MATTLIQARKLLTAAELDVFAASRAEALKALTAVQLRGKIKRSRTLRDKYQDLLRRQKVATRGRTGSKAGTSGVANERTAPRRPRPGWRDSRRSRPSPSPAAHARRRAARRRRPRCQWR